MKKKVVAIIDNAEHCPYFRYTQLGTMEKLLKSAKVAHRPMCYSPAVSKPGYLRPCSCVFDKATNKYIIKEGCPLESIIDEATVNAVLAQLKMQAASEDDVTEEQQNEEQTLQAIDMQEGK